MADGYVNALGRTAKSVFGEEFLKTVGVNFGNPLRTNFEAAIASVAGNSVYHPPETIALWIERASRHVIDEGNVSKSPALVAHEIGAALADYRQSPSPDIGDPYQRLVDRTFVGQPGFPAMADCLDELASYPVSGLPETRQGVADLIRAQAVENLRAITDDNGIGHAIGRTIEMSGPEEVDAIEQAAAAYAVAKAVGTLAADSFHKLSAAHPEIGNDAYLLRAVEQATQSIIQNRAVDLYISADIGPRDLSRAAMHETASFGADLVPTMIDRARMRTGSVLFDRHAYEREVVAMGHLEKSGLATPDEVAAFKGYVDQIRAKLPLELRVIPGGYDVDQDRDIEVRDPVRGWREPEVEVAAWKTEHRRELENTGISMGF